MLPLDEYWENKTAPREAGAGGVLIRNAFTIASANLILPSANILVRNGLIEWIEATDSPILARTWDREVDASRFMITPGLINAHTHAALSYLRGHVHGQKQMIENLFFKTEKNLSAELLEPLSYAYIYDGLRSGVTVFGDHYYFIEGVAKALNRFGVRGVVGETICDLGGAFPDPKRWTMAKKAIESWSHGPRVLPLVAPHAADTVSSELLKDTADFAKAHNLPLHMHLSQTKSEREAVGKRTSLSPVSYAARAGALGERSLVVHLVSTDSRDLKILADYGVTVGFCPASQILYERLSPLSEFLRLKLPLAVATDCAPSNDSADLWSELKLTALLAQHHTCDSADYAPEALLPMVTTNPAHVFGLQKTLGTVEAGKAADLVFIKRDLLTDPLDAPLANIIYGAGSRNVQHVMVDGRWVLWKQQVVAMKEDELYETFMAARNDIFRRMRA